MTIPDIPRAVAHARLAKAVQAGRPAEQIELLRAEYHACAARDRIREVAPRLLPEHRAELAVLLTTGGGDLAA